MADRFAIQPYDKNSGLRTNVKPFLIPDEAFSELNNAYVFRGRVRKRFGTRWTGGGNANQLTSRLAVPFSSIDPLTGATNPGTGSFSQAVPLTAGVPTVTPAAGQIFSAGTQIFTVTAATLVAPYPLLATETATNAIFNPLTGLFSFTGDSLTNLGVPVYYFPALPVMGLPTIENGNINNEPNVAFDTRFAYQWNGTTWLRLALENEAGSAQWTGTDINFFWAVTYVGAVASEDVLFVTNNNPNEPNALRYIDNTKTWFQFKPLLFDQTDAISGVHTQIYLVGAQILTQFKNRMLAGNTWELTYLDGVAQLPAVNYKNRFTYSQAFGSALDQANGWRRDLPGRGGANDCATTESMISCEFLKDQLITFFERSTWSFRYQQNQAFPFTFEKINTELGLEGTFSIVPFDKVCIGVGQSGIIACNGANVERIDDSIPDTVFQINNYNGPGASQRIYGIRDYNAEQIYWAIPDNTQTAISPYPNKVIVYNYKNGTWAFNDDSITCFGYIQDITATGVLWDSTTVFWDSDITWDSGELTSNNRQPIAGNQQGFIFEIDIDANQNAQVLQITQLTSILDTGSEITLTVINHNLDQGSFIYINGIVDNVGNMGLLNNNIFMIIETPSVNTITIQTSYLSSSFPENPSIYIVGTYAGGGTIARVSQISIKTKEYNFYASQGTNASISKVDMMFDRTDAKEPYDPDEDAKGIINVDYFVSTSSIGMISASNELATDALLGTGAIQTAPYSIYPYEATASRVWRSIYIQAEGECIQLQITQNNAQILDLFNMGQPFALHSMIFEARPSGRIQ